MRKVLTWAALLVMGSVSVSAAELAVLRTGFTIRHERREAIGTTTRLYLTEDAGYVDIPTDQIEAFAPDDSPAISEPKPAVENIPALVREAGLRHGIDPEFLSSVISAESGFNVKAVSPKGARGLMQLMPDTAVRLGVEDSFDPAANIEGGTRFLRDLLVRYNGDAVKALAAYNAGSQRVEFYHGVPPYRETQAYVARIIRDYNRKKLAEQAAAKRPKAGPKHAATSKQSMQKAGGQN